MNSVEGSLKILIKHHRKQMSLKIPPLSVDLHCWVNIAIPKNTSSCSVLQPCVTFINPPRSPETLRWRCVFWGHWHCSLHHTGIGSKSKGYQGWGGGEGGSPGHDRNDPRCVRKLQHKHFQLPKFVWAELAWIYTSNWFPWQHMQLCMQRFAVFVQWCGVSFSLNSVKWEKWDCVSCPRPRQDLCRNAVLNL